MLLDNVIASMRFDKSCKTVTLRKIAAWEKWPFFPGTDLPALATFHLILLIFLQTQYH